jgi:hypothetical protein
MLIIAVISLALILGTAASAEIQVLKSDSGKEYGEMNLSVISAMEIYDLPGMDIAEAVKFNAPSSGFSIKQIDVVGFDGYNGSRLTTTPWETTIALEIRDKDLNLLYSFTDSQIPYFNYIYNSTKLVPARFDIPSIRVNGDFYVCFYDRGAVYVAYERNNSSGNSYMFQRATNSMVPALPDAGNKTYPINWVIRVGGI